MLPASVEQAAQQAAANAANHGAAPAIDGISASGAGARSNHLTGRARSEQEQSKNRADRESGSHVFISFKPVNRREGLLFRRLSCFIFLEGAADHLLIF
jgi:hypothetical protein